MPKPSNVELLAERRAIAELVAGFDGENNTERVKSALEKLAAQRVALDAMQRIPKIDLTPGPITPFPIQPENGDGLQPMSSAPASLAPEKIPDGPVDRAHYPAPGEAGSRVNTQQVDAGPAQSTSLGDLTPGYARWFCSTNGPEATRARYNGRTQHLPADVRAAIQ